MVISTSTEPSPSKLAIGTITTATARNTSASSLPDAVKARLLALHDSRITKEGVLVLKAQQHRTQEMNRFDAMVRLQELVNSVAHAPKTRRPTQPTKASRQRLRQAKAQRAGLKMQRAPVPHED